MQTVGVVIHILLENITNSSYVTLQNFDLFQCFDFSIFLSLTHLGVQSNKKSTVDASRDINKYDWTTWQLFIIRIKEKYTTKLF